MVSRVEDFADLWNRVSESRLPHLASASHLRRHSLGIHEGCCLSQMQTARRPLSEPGSVCVSRFRLSRLVHGDDRVESSVSTFPNRLDASEVDSRTTGGANQVGEKTVIPGIR